MLYNRAWDYEKKKMYKMIGEVVSTIGNSTQTMAFLSDFDKTPELSSEDILISHTYHRMQRVNKYLYEGDIVLLQVNQENAVYFVYGVLEFNPKKLAYEFKVHSQPPFYIPYDDKLKKVYRIVGTIFTHPHLLEPKEGFH